MNVCKKNRQLIACLAMTALDARNEEKLRRHLQTCAGCQAYFEEMSILTQQFAKAEIPIDVQATDAFHHRVLNAFRAEEAKANPLELVVRVSGKLLNWRVAVPVFGAAAVAIFLVFTSLRPTSIPALAPAGGEVASDPHPQRDLVPTISNYEIVANKSFDQFDKLLTAQGSKNLPSAPVYKASSFSMQTSAD
jgi:hypothetical protein